MKERPPELGPEAGQKVVLSDGTVTIYEHEMRHIGEIIAEISTSEHQELTFILQSAVEPHPLSDSSEAKEVKDLAAAYQCDRMDVLRMMRPQHYGALLFKDVPLSVLQELVENPEDFESSWELEQKIKKRLREEDVPLHV